MAYCTFISPTTLSAFANRSVYPRISLSTSGFRLTEGSTHDESPE